MGDDQLQALRDVLYEALSDDWEISSAGYRKAARAVLDAGWSRAGQAATTPDATPELIQQLAAIMHAANDGEDCTCHAAAREEFEVCAEVALTWLTERGLRAATPDGPRRWALPEIPEDVTVLRTRWGTPYTRNPHDPEKWGTGTSREFTIAELMLYGGGHLTDATPAADGQDGRDG